MQSHVIESLEVVAAAIVTVGLVAGNLFLFSPLRSDDRVRVLNPQPSELSFVEEQHGKQP